MKWSEALCLIVLILAIGAVLFRAVSCADDPKYLQSECVSICVTQAKTLCITTGHTCFSEAMERCRETCDLGASDEETTDDD